MPTEQGLLTAAEIHSQSRESHLIRTRDRIAYWEGRLRDADQVEAAIRAGQKTPVGLCPMTQGERGLAQQEIETFKQQLHDPRTERSLQMAPLKQPTMPSVFAQMFQTLQEQIAQLEAKLKGQDARGVVGEVPEAPAQAPKAQD